ncbi:MAG: putative Rossmann-fold nucleotide-binding protein [Myxococcota bacterium]
MIGDSAAIAVLGPTTADNAVQTDALAATLGSELARVGFAVVTHGDGPVAQAVLRAARTGGGRVHPVVYPGANEVEAESGTLDAQSAALTALDRVLRLSDAVILLPGGLSAAALIVQVMLFGETQNGPFRQTIIVGAGWTGKIGQLGDALGLDARQRAMLTFAETPQEAVEALRYYVSGRT